MASKTDKLLRSLRSRTEKKTAIASNMFVPNHSGDHSAGQVLTTPTNNNDIVNKKYCDDNFSNLTEDETITGSWTFEHQSLEGTPKISFTSAANAIVTGESIKIDDTSALAVTGTPIVIKSKNSTAFEIFDSGGTKNIQFLSAGGMYLNFSQAASPFFNMKGDTDTNLLYVKASNDSVGFGRQPTTSGAIEIAKDVTFHGDGTGLAYGGFYGNSINWSQVFPTQNTWYNISDTDATDSNGGLNGMTHDGSGKLTINKPGRYLINYNITAEAGTGKSSFESGVEVDGGGVPINDGQATQYFGLAGEEYQLSGTMILDLSSTQTLELSIRTIDSGVNSITVNKINMTAVMIGGT